ncbi:Crp/Fnr family transcriptional regulator [Variovorax terrae]|uniref:Cyclic nucleotide-binding domain-containing protein n=1 Tax=Variovorax terrae TaxID=2923278 RepID=A0A9X1VY86_9BURK|nr:cyclic nucleotide-binding domain-containing protein [Variovorax terrae]MCJ0765672.1 cyclic nucleotide-binding domain-containing protein [Variovorax terrae]
MNAPLPTHLKFDVQGLAQAMAHNHAVDGFKLTLTPAQWDILASYMQPFALMQGQVLIEQGAVDRTLYVVESGSLSVHYKDEKSRVRLAILGPGSVVGEGSFFSHLPRNATVQAASHSKVWSLTPIRFTELANRQPSVALEISLGLGAVVAKRLVNRPKRVAVT